MGDVLYTTHIHTVTHDHPRCNVFSHTHTCFNSVSCEVRVYTYHNRTPTQLRACMCIAMVAARVHVHCDDRDMRPYAPYGRIAVIAMAVITCVDDTSRLDLASERTRIATRGTGA